MFDRNRLRLKPLGERVHDDFPRDLAFWTSRQSEFVNSDIPTICNRIIKARDKKRAIIWILGAHVVRKGLSPLIIDLMKRGFISHIATNGAASIHDFELALIGATAEDVARYIQEGQFGLWQETGRMNEAINQGNEQRLGYGEAVGKMITEENFPFRELSLFAAAYEMEMPVTVHVGIGCDITHQHPNCDGAAIGAASYRDFLTFASAVENLEGGVILNFGTAVTGPEVYLKALAMARNVARQEGKEIKRFTTAVFDIVNIGDNISDEAPKDTPSYYFRPYKTMLVRTVADGGESFYVKGNHVDTLPALFKELSDENPT